MHRLRRTVPIVGLIAGEIAATVTLHRLGRVDGFGLPSGALRPWLMHAPTEELVAVVGRLAGLAVSWWLLVATLLSLARRVVPACRHLRGLDVLTPRAVRRIVERTVAVGVGASLGLSGIHPIGAVTAPTRPRVDAPVVRSAPAATDPSASRPERTRASEPSHGPPNDVVVVRAGDNLWVIARRALEGEGHAAGSPEVARYWRRVIAANRAAIRSHDPDLIFPGERILLPPRSDAGTAAG